MAAGAELALLLPSPWPSPWPCPQLCPCNVPCAIRSSRTCNDWRIGARCTDCHACIAPGWNKGTPPHQGCMGSPGTAGSSTAQAWRARQWQFFKGLSLETLMMFLDGLLLLPYGSCHVSWACALGYGVAYVTGAESTGLCPRHHHHHHPPPSPPLSPSSPPHPAPNPFPSPSS